MSKKLYVPYKVKTKRLIELGCRWAVYKREYGQIWPTYYGTKAEANKNKNCVSE